MGGQGPNVQTIINIINARRNGSVFPISVKPYYVERMEYSLKHIEPWNKVTCNDPEVAEWIQTQELSLWRNTGEVNVFFVRDQLMNWMKLKWE